MTGHSMKRRSVIVDVIEKLGSCAVLISMDPNFHEISVGLFVKSGLATVWSFSRRPGVRERMEQIRGQLVALGGMVPFEGTHDGAKFACGQIHGRPTQFLMRRAVEKEPSWVLPEGKTKDLRSSLMLGFDAREEDGRWVYRVTADGEAPNKPHRIRAVTGGLVRYSEMEKLDGDGVTFSCGYRHDELVRLALPYARNVTGAEDALAADALRGQMTTGTLGFAPPT